MQSNSYFNNLTPLRGIAALLTVIFHVGITVGPLVNIFRLAVTPGPLVEHTMLLNKMYLMVDFFFILSGFIMSHVYGKPFRDDVTGANFKKFTVARFARVYPLHLAMLLYLVMLFSVSAELHVPIMPPMQVDNNVYSFFTNLFLLQSMNFHDWFTWVHASWSISTEWWVYMLFPFLVKPFFRLNPAGRWAVALLCFIGYLVIMFFLAPVVTTPAIIPLKVSPADYSINISYQFGFFRCLFGFVLGMVAYQLYLAGWNRTVLGNGYVMIVATLCLFISMHFGLPDIVTVCFFPFILLSGAYGSTGIDKVFSTSPMQRIGDWSFSIYLVHQPLLFTVGNVCTYFGLKLNLANASQGQLMLTGWIICILFLALLLPLSYLTYEFIERPARAVLNSKSRRKLELSKP